MPWTSSSTRRRVGDLLVEEDGLAKDTTKLARYQGRRHVLFVWASW